MEDQKLLNKSQYEYAKVNRSWKKKKISWMFNVISSGTTPKSSNEDYFNGEINWLNTGDLNDGYIIGTSKTITEMAIEDYSTLKIYPQNSLVMAMYGATIGKLGITKISTSTNQACCVMAEPIDVFAKFVFYWLLGNRDEIINLSQGGGQPNINQDIIRNLKFYVPNIDEQKRISFFLDQKTSEIDSLIADKEKLIELLEEKRQAIITEAVTKGLNPDVKMKDSGVEWIGEIPEHWEITKLKRYLKVMNGKEIEKELEIDDQEAVDVYGSGGAFKKTDKSIFNGKSVLFGRKGTLGKVLYVDQPFWTVDTMYWTKFYKESFAKWFYYILSAFPWSIHATNTALPSIIGTDIENDVWAIPNYNEQKAISLFLDEKLFSINSLILEIEIQIQKLKEYRQSLIYEAVTGKIDVRNYNQESS